MIFDSCRAILFNERGIYWYIYTVVTGFFENSHE